MAVVIKFRNDVSSNWISQGSILELGEVGIETDTRRIKVGDGTTPYTALSYFDVPGPSQNDRYKSLGDGSDGDVVVSSGIVVLDRDMYYNNLTVEGTGSIFTNNYKIFVKNRLDLSNASSSAIHNNGESGTNAVLNVPGTVALVPPIGTMLGGGQGTQGAIGVVGAGTTAASVGGITGNGGVSNSSGNGGAGVNAGATGGTGSIPTAQDISLFYTNFLRGVALVGGGSGGRGGASGGGSGVNPGGAGGAGGNGGGVVAIYANKIVTSSNTSSSCITALGGNGGNGGDGSASGCGAGGGGAGGGGGWITIFYNKRYGPLVSNMLDVSGGAGGNGGNGNGIIPATGALALGGGRGQGGYGGRITTYRIVDETGRTFFAVSDITFNPRVTPTPTAQTDGIGKAGGLSGSLLVDF